ncbi:MAG: sulfite exporter TauE/SafE family protein [Candidatus Hodarchaeota archaeon]
MQGLLIEILMIAAFAVGVGTISSMIGIGGGILNTPLLVIVFALTTNMARATSLVAALFVAISSSFAYYRQNPSPTVYRAGFFLAITTIPGSWVGGWLAVTIFNTYGDFALRWVFAFLLFPVALKMLFARRKGKVDWVSEIEAFDFAQIPKKTLGFALAGGFLGGIVANLLGLGGGVIIVPVLSMIMGLPMHAAAATSMFTMIFTTSAGTVQNILSQSVDIFYALALGIGMLTGAQIGSRLATRVDSVRLKHIFGLVLVYPLVRMVEAGRYLMGDDFLLKTIGDVIVWLAIVVPIGLITLYWRRNEPEGIVEEEPREVSTSGES